jgi:acyl-CoA hydrolase
VLDESAELDQGGVRVAVAEVFHGEAVASEGVCGIELQDFRESGDLVHDVMVRCLGLAWQVWATRPRRWFGQFRLVRMSDLVLERTVAESQSERSEIVFPADANALGNLFGGRLMQYIDLVGAMAASRHARAITVTASMDHLDFVAPVHVGDLLILKASVNRAYRTSMEVGVKAMVEDVRENRLRHVSSAYLTYVAVDKDGHGLVVPKVVPKTEHQKRRYEDAARRREMRGDETMRKKEMRAALPDGWHI